MFQISFLKINLFILHTNACCLSLPFSCSATFLLCTFHPFLLDGSITPMGSKQSLSYQLRKDQDCRLRQGMCSKKSVHTLGIKSGNPSNCQSHTTVTQLKGPSFIICRFPNCQSRVDDLPLTLLSCFCGYCQHVFNNLIILLFFPLYE